MPGGNSLEASASSARTAWAVLSAFDPGSWVMAMMTEDFPER